jgi:nitrile hydratase accessory protein
MSDAHAVLPGQPHDDEGPVFREPWECQVFALAVALHQRGVFSWADWSQGLAAQIAMAQSAGDADLDCYYHHWLNALERLVVAKGASSMEELMRYHHAWEHVAGRTPHGQPFDLQPEDFAPQL